MSSMPPSGPRAGRRASPGARGRLGGALVSLALLLCAGSAGAKTTVAGDLQYASPVHSAVNNGWGLGIRLGQQIHVPLVVVNPELGFDYHTFAEDGAPRVYRGLGGLRIGVGEIFRPGAFVHAGVGRLSLPRTPDLSHTAFTYDAGLFFDFTLLPLLDVGVHGAYNRVLADDRVDAFQFLTGGAHVALVF